MCLKNQLSYTNLSVHKVLVHDSANTKAKVKVIKFVMSSMYSVQCVLIPSFFNLIQILVNKTKVKRDRLVRLLNSPIFVVQRAATHKNGVECCQKSIVCGYIVRCCATSVPFSTNQKFVVFSWVGVQSQFSDRFYQADQYSAIQTMVVLPGIITVCCAYDQQLSENILHKGKVANTFVYFIHQQA